MGTIKFEFVPIETESNLNTAVVGCDSLIWCRWLLCLWNIARMDMEDATLAIHASSLKIHDLYTNRGMGDEDIGGSF
jgi:hypothetical protein